MDTNLEEEEGEKSCLRRKPVDGALATSGPRRVILGAHAFAGLLFYAADERVAIDCRRPM